jgi:hypothetical protein
VHCSRRVLTYLLVLRQRSEEDCPQWPHY